MQDWGRFTNDVFQSLLIKSWSELILYVARITSLILFWYCIRRQHGRYRGG